MLEDLTSADFKQLLNQKFIVRLAPLADIEIELEQVTELSSEPYLPGANPRRPFSLIFRGPQGPTYLRQHTYRLEQPGLDELDVFLVPIGPKDGRMGYEAIFT